MLRLHCVRRRLPSSKSAITLLVLAAALALAGASDAGKAPPRIVAAILQDSDGDFRADALRLTYSQAIRHAADRDRTYPFSVSAYRIRAIGAARGRVLVIGLFERSAPDPTARPSVRYRPTRSKPVRNKTGSQAVTQIFRGTRAHGHTPPPATTTTTAAAAPVALDRDGDGVPDTTDCAPLDKSIHPGADDLPDLGFVDSDCDGIDGQEAKAVFVSLLGKDTNPGTKAAPKRFVSAAVVAAAGTGRYVLVAAGDYPGVTAATGVGIFGGYDAGNWRRGGTAATRILGTTQGLLADNATDVVLQFVDVIGLPGDPAGDRSVYGIRAVNGSSLTLQRVNVLADRAIDGLPGANGRAGPNGTSGEAGHPGIFRAGVTSCPILSNSDGLRSKGGRGGTSPAGRTGGSGGDGGAEGSNSGKAGGEGKFGVPGGAGGKGGNPGGPGGNGASGGAAGAPGLGGDGGTSSTAGAVATWRGGSGGSGRVGGAGNGGGGGGGSGGRGGRFVFDKPGHGGGGGGGGGAPGFPGDGGSFGGGSFGIYLFNSTLTAESSSVTAGDGGAGGRGGNGGAGGRGGVGGQRAEGCPVEVREAGEGGRGADGGIGGAGAGGAGGPSIGVIRLGSSAASTLTSSTVKFGRPGQGGAPGIGGSATAKPSQPGIAQAIYP